MGGETQDDTFLRFKFINIALNGFGTSLPPTFIGGKFADIEKLSMVSMIRLSSWKIFKLVPCPLELISEKYLIC